jgi:hypothetical protein
MQARVTSEPRLPSTRVARSSWPGRLGHQERAGEVDPDHPVPFGSVKQMDRAAAGNAGRVDDPVEAVGHGGQHSGDRGFVGHVGRHEREPRAQVQRGSQVGARQHRHDPRRGEPIEDGIEEPQAAPKAVALDIRDASIRELVEELGRRMDAYGLRLSRSRLHGLVASRLR